MLVSIIIEISFVTNLCFEFETGNLGCAYVTARWSKKRTRKIDTGTRNVNTAFWKRENPMYVVFDKLSTIDCDL